jgi:hypothetical protein
MNSKKNPKKRGPKPSGTRPLKIKLMEKHFRWLQYLVGKATYGQSEERVVESLLFKAFREMIATNELPENLPAVEIFALPQRDGAPASEPEIPKSSSLAQNSENTA